MRRDAGMPRSRIGRRAKRLGITYAAAHWRERHKRDTRKPRRDRGTVRSLYSIIARRLGVTRQCIWYRENKR